MNREIYSKNVNRNECHISSRNANIRVLRFVSRMSIQTSTELANLSWAHKMVANCIGDGTIINDGATILRMWKVKLEHSA